MTDNHKFLTGLLLGAAAGVALTLFLSSEKGKELISQVKDSADILEDDLHKKWEEVDIVMNDLFTKGKSFLEDLEQKLSQSA